jgi:hypothetical protein
VVDLAPGLSDLRCDKWDGTFRMPEPTPEQAASNKRFMDYVMNVMRQENRRREWALRQVFMECLAHYRETMQLVRYER